jgi:hypothetical protein
MTRRMIDSAMWSNENFAALPVMARLLQVGIINMADDQGRVKAFPAYLRSQVFPYDDVSIDDIRKWLTLIANNGTIAIYQADGKDYIQLLNWWEYQSLQYPAPSEYPAQPGWQDRVRYNAKGGVVLTYNYTTIKGERLPDTCDPRGNPIVRSYGRPPETPPVSPQENPPGLPPGIPGGRPGGRPLEAPIQLEDQDNTDQQEQMDEDDTRTRDPIHVAWLETYEEELPDNLEKPFAKLLKETSEAAVIHGIRKSASAKERTFGFIAKCARNYIPPPPENANYTNGYHIETDSIPGIHALTPVADAQPQTLPRPMPTDDPWATVLFELLPTLTPTTAGWFKDSELTENGELAGVPFYLITVRTGPDKLPWLKRQTESNIRRKLGSLIGKRVEIDFVATELEPTP